MYRIQEKEPASLNAFIQKEQQKDVRGVVPQVAAFVLSLALGSFIVAFDHVLYVMQSVTATHGESSFNVKAGLDLDAKVHGGAAIKPLVDRFFSQLKVTRDVFVEDQGRWDVLRLGDAFD